MDGQVLDPQCPRRLAQLDTFQQHPVECDEHRDLDQDRQAAAERVDFLGLVHLHHRLVQFRLVVAITFLERRHARLHFAHVRHGPVAGARQRIEHGLDEDGEQDNRPAPVAHQFVQPREQPEQRGGDDREPAVIDGENHAFAQFFEACVFFGADIELCAQRRLSARRDGDRCECLVADGEQVPRLRVAVELAAVFGARQPGAEEIVLQHRHPTAIGVARQRLVAHLVEVDFFVFLFLGVDHAATVGGQGGEPVAGFFVAAQKLRVEIGIKRLAPGIGDFVAQVHSVVIAVEGVNLGDTQTFGAGPI